MIYITTKNCDRSHFTITSKSMYADSETFARFTATRKHDLLRNVNAIDLKKSVRASRANKT